jgi:hypothetical protein
VAKNMTRGQLQDLLERFAGESEANRQALIDDPRAVIEHQIGYSLGDTRVEVLVETADTIYVVVPHVAGDRQLSEGELAEVSGGMGDWGGGDVQDGGSWS